MLAMLWIKLLFLSEELFLVLIRVSEGRMVTNIAVEWETPETQTFIIPPETINRLLPG